MNVLEVSAQISALSKIFLTYGTLEGSLACMLPKVIPQVTGLLENRLASGIVAFEEELGSLSLRVLHSNSGVPLLRDSLKRL